MSLTILNVYCIFMYINRNEKLMRDHFYIFIVKLYLIYINKPIKNLQGKCLLAYVFFTFKAASCIACV